LRKRHFFRRKFVENRRKSQKIVITTSTPAQQHLKCQGFVGQHRVAEIYPGPMAMGLQCGLTFPYVLHRATKKEKKEMVTLRRLDELELLRVGLDEPLDQVDLLQGDLHGVLVLGPAGRVRHPQLQTQHNFFVITMTSYGFTIP
jgi:hypothetical protein